MYDVFISYASQDQEQANYVQSFLEAHGITVLPADCSNQTQADFRSCVVIIPKNTLTSDGIQQFVDAAIEEGKLFCSQTGRRVSASLSPI